MDPLRILCQTQGFFTRAEAAEAGYADRDVTRMMRGRVWHRIRRGYYTYADIWADLDDVGRHRVRGLAVAFSLGSAVALSHVSAAVMHGVSVWNVDLRRVHVTRLDGGAGRTERDVVHHEGLCLDDDVTELDGHRVIVPDRCVVEAASRVSQEAALVMFDSALHHELFDVDTLRARYELMAPWPFMRHLHVPVRMARPGSESIGETRGNWLCWVFHLPAPKPQFKVYDADGVLRGICDWGWPEHRLLGEFDGQVKYGRLLKPGQDPGEVVFAEKYREDLLRELSGFGMVRLIWVDYERPRATAARIERQLRRAA
jgi:hypothetical protein